MGVAKWTELHAKTTATTDPQGSSTNAPTRGPLVSVNGLSCHHCVTPTTPKWSTMRTSSCNELQHRRRGCGRGKSGLTGFRTSSGSSGGFCSLQAHRVDGHGLFSHGTKSCHGWIFQGLTCPKVAHAQRGPQARRRNGHCPECGKEATLISESEARLQLHAAWLCLPIPRACSRFSRPPLTQREVNCEALQWHKRDMAVRGETSSARAKLPNTNRDHNDQGA